MIGERRRRETAPRAAPTLARAPRRRPRATSAECAPWTVTDLAGRATVSLPIPYAPAFVGVELHEQFAVLANQNALGISFSNGAFVEIGTC